MKSNYKIVNGIYLVQASHELDLHNYFNFTGLNYSVEERKLILSWVRSKREGVSSDLPKSLTIEFSEVSEFRFMPRDAEVPFTEDDCIDTFGYWADEEWSEGVFTLVTDSQQPEPHWLTAIDFMSGAVILLQAEEARAKIVA